MSQKSEGGRQIAAYLTWYTAYLEYSKMFLRSPLLFSALAAVLLGCEAQREPALDSAQSWRIRAEIEQHVRAAYDLGGEQVVERMLALYPDQGAVVSASGGRVMTSRDSLERGIRHFWTNVGRNMRDPTWVWDEFHVDVLSPSSAVVTATYRIPHVTPQNRRHELGGAMTMVFQKRGDRWVIVQEHLSDFPDILGDSIATDHDH